MVVAHKEEASGKSRMVPSFAVQGGEAAEFFVGVRAGAGEDDGTRFALDEDEVIDEQGLAGAEAAVFPAAFASGGFDASEETVVESVDEAVTTGAGVELVFHGASAPEFRDGEFATGEGFDLEHETANAVAGGEEDAVVVEDDRLRGTGRLFTGPRVVHKDGSVGGVVDGEGGGVDGEDDATASEVGKDGGRIAGLVGPGAPEGLSGLAMVGEHGGAVGSSTCDDDGVIVNQR